MIFIVTSHPHVGKMLCCFQMFCRLPVSCHSVLEGWVYTWLQLGKQNDFPKSENVITNNQIRTLHMNFLCFFSILSSLGCFFFLDENGLSAKLCFLIPLSLKTDIFLRSWTVSKPQEIYFNRSETWAKLSSRFSIWRMDLWWAREGPHDFEMHGRKDAGLLWA